MQQRTKALLSLFRSSLSALAGHLSIFSACLVLMFSILLIQYRSYRHIIIAVAVAAAVAAAVVVIAVVLAILRRASNLRPESEPG